LRGSDPASPNAHLKALWITRYLALVMPDSPTVSLFALESLTHLQPNGDFPTFSEASLAVKMWTQNIQMISCDIQITVLLMAF
jgi:hypothetical protein